MVNIGDLLGNYLKIKNPQEDKKKVVDAVKKGLGVEIMENQIFFRKNTAIFKVSPVLKSFLYIRKEKLLSIIKEAVPNRFIDTINF